MFVISIFVVVEERVVNSKCIFMLFLVFVRQFLVYLSELFWSKFARASIFIMLLPFYFSALNLSIYLSIFLSIYLPTSNLPTNLSIRSYLSKFSKSSFISRNSTIYQKSLRNDVLFVLAWVAWVACLRGWRASMGDVGGVLAWVAC